MEQVPVRFLFLRGCSFPFFSHFSFRMMLVNFLGRKGRETCLKGVVVFSAGWDVFECTASLEKPLDRFLFNSYLTSCLQASVDRSARARKGLTLWLTPGQGEAVKGLKPAISGL